MAEDIKKTANDEIVFLEHPPWPGYRKVFYLLFVLGTLYLLLAFSGLFSPGGH